MKRGALAVAMAISLLAVLPGSALAAPAQDQSNAAGLPYAGGTMAQTFTAGITGSLTSVDLYLASNNAESQSISLEGVDGSSLPDGTVLATASQSIPNTGYANPAWYTFTFGSPAHVTSGTQYAIVMTTVNVNWTGTAADAYAGGAAWSLNGNWISFGGLADFSFITFVDAAVAAPTAGNGTLPPTATAPDGNPGGEAPLWILAYLVATVIAAAAAVSVRRRAARR